MKLNSEKSKEDTDDLAPSQVLQEFTENIDKVQYVWTSKLYNTRTSSLNNWIRQFYKTLFGVERLQFS